MDTLFAVVSYDKTEAIVRIADGRIDTIVGDLGGAVNSENTGGSHGTKASGPSLLVPASVARMPDGGAAVGSSQQPVVLRLGRTGTMLWRRELLVPDLPGPLPRDAPADVRLAAYRVSSLVAIGANRLLATLFRPGRPQTVVKILTMGGEEGGTAVLPIPTWYYGVVRGRFLIAGQISDRHELASYELQF